jgi:drug/metabolite transporter (DMT)-like permease
MTTHAHSHRLPRGVLAGLAAALLFGAGTPMAKLLLAQTSPWLLAAMLYLGSGIGLSLLRALRHRPAHGVARGDLKWLVGAVFAGGIIGPVLLMLGLVSMPAGPASLLLNAEAVFTSLLAWFVFKENVDRRVALGMLAIVAGGLTLAWPGQVDWPGWRPLLYVIGACLAWAIDNNLTRKVALADASWIAMVKGLAAGATNLALALALGAAWPAWPVVLAAAALGFASYGASLALFVVALRELGTARTGASFSVAPFFGAALAVALLGEPASWPLLAAGALMAAGVALHLSERHEHHHAHAPMEHTHEHLHGPEDPHHEHAHEAAPGRATPHTHAHRHQPLLHSHAHFPEAHHRHEH